MHLMGIEIMDTKQEPFGLNKLRDLIRERNLEAGWIKKPNWLERKFPSLYKKRDKATLIALIHSEASEALEGARKGIKDDHLPHHDMDHVEMADVLIRTLDYCGEYGIDIDGIVAEKLEYNKQREDHKLKNRKKSGGKKF